MQRLERVPHLNLRLGAHSAALRQPPSAPSATRASSARYKLHVDVERARERAERRRRRIRLAALDAADLGLVDARQLGELLLREAPLAPARAELAGEREVEAERLELGDGLGALGLGLGFQLLDEVVEGVVMAISDTVL